MKIKKGDTVVVMSGKDRSKTGTVLRTFPKKGFVLVEGVNMVKRHKKATKRGSQGQILAKPMPFPASNVALKGEGGKGVRVGYRVEKKDGKRTKVRIARKTGKEI